MPGGKSSKVKSRMIMEKPCAMVAYAISYAESVHTPQFSPSLTFYADN